MADLLSLQNHMEILYIVYYNDFAACDVVHSLREKEEHAAKSGFFCTVHRRKLDPEIGF
jgi:hypothetical protein